MPRMASVCVGLWVGVGGRYEHECVSGVAHFIEHLLFKGTGRRSAAQISQSVEGIGGYLNAFTCEETTCFFARAHHSRLGELLDVLVDMFLNSKFAPAGHREGTRRDQGRDRDVSRPAGKLVQELLHETLWPESSLGRPLTGTEQTLDATRRGELLEFLRGNYVSQNTLLVVAGPLAHKRSDSRVPEICTEISRREKAVVRPC
jgi:predicted Zn-dependent peptidase